MCAKIKTTGYSQRLTLAKLTPPDWYGYAVVVATLLLTTVRIDFQDRPYFFPLLSLGEWLLLPLGVLSLTMGFLSLSRLREKTVLPLWLSAICPALLFLAAAGASMLFNRPGPASMDIILSWAAHLVFPTLAMLPLFALRPWRDRLMWALAAGLVINTVLILIQGRGTGMAGESVLGLGGFLANQHDFGLQLALTLPLLASWRGGEGSGPNKSLAVLFTTFLLPALTLSACYAWAGLAAAGVGLLIAWASWRSHAWILGIFLALVVMGYGGESSRTHEEQRRGTLAATAAPESGAYAKALNTFEVRPFLGSGPERFIAGNGHEPADTVQANPWYATLLGGSGLLGLGMWLVMVGELAARTMGRFGRRCIWHGGVLGGVVGMLVAGFWTDCMPEGAGAMVGVLIALSILEEPDSHHFPMRGKNGGVRESRRVTQPRQQPAPQQQSAPEGKKQGDTEILPKRG